ncbi:hypothetical protein LXA43DRAFT_1094519 [Ganoderma leucocontextum]|nr:hypothetical protein LXA43DRAFT_1094519 [Ganoderma leucocontextum]
MPEPGGVSSQTPQDEQADPGTNPSTAIKANFTMTLARSTVVSPIPASRLISAPAISLTTSKTAGVSSASAPAADAIASQSTTPNPPSPTTTASSSAPTEGSSTGTPQTSRFDSAQPSAHPPIHNSLGLYAGITFGAIVGVGVVIALTAYWLRVRARVHRRSMNRMTTWPWDHDRLGARQDTLEGGDGDRGALRNWDPARMVDASDAGKTRFPIEEDLPAPATNPRQQDSHAFPLPPAAVRAHLDRPTYTASPFVTVPLHANRDREQSVPDIMQEMGTLKITNLMPGDIVTSGGESSRASTALGFRDGSPDDVASPTLSYAMTSGDDSTPRLPWAPLRTWKSSGGWQEGHTLEDGDVPLPFPGDSPAAPEPEIETETKQDGWAVSIRSNLVSALNAVVGGNASQGKMAETGSDNLTRPPERRTSQRHRGVRGRHESAGGMSRSGTVSSASSPSRWTLEETEHGRGVVRFRGHPEQGSPLTEDPFSDDSQVPPEGTAAHEHGGANLKTLDSVSGTANGQPTSAGTPETTLARPHPPRLPSIPSVSRSSSVEEEPEAGPARKKTRFQHRKRTKRRRPAVVTRKSSSQSSAVSVGSDMSRMSSVASEGLTDAERFAKHVLRERRRRVIDMAVGRGKPSRSKATTISRRRPKETFKQRLEKEES